LRLLEEKVVELHIVDQVSDNTIGRTLKKNILSAPSEAGAFQPVHVRRG
jgi:hypothetical protein